MGALQGPVLSGHKKLVAEKLAEEEAERKVKSDAKKEKHLVIQFFSKFEICVCFGHNARARISMSLYLFFIFFRLVSYFY